MHKQIFLILLILVVFSINGSIRALILQNRACGSDNSLVCNYNRTFTPQTDETAVLAVTNTSLAVFFDVLENVNIEMNC